jgi:hypothetical protein
VPFWAGSPPKEKPVDLILIESITRLTEARNYAFSRGTKLIMLLSVSN